MVCDDRVAAQLLEAFHECEKVVDMVWIELEGWHGRMTGIDSLGKGLRQRLDFVAPVEIAERRSYFQRAWIESVDGMAARTVCFREIEPTLFGG